MRRRGSRFLAWILTEDLADVIEGNLVEESRRRRAAGGWKAEVVATEPIRRGRHSNGRGRG